MNGEYTIRCKQPIITKVYGKRKMSINSFVILLLPIPMMFSALVQWQFAFSRKITFGIIAVFFIVDRHLVNFRLIKFLLICCEFICYLLSINFLLNYKGRFRNLIFIQQRKRPHIFESVASIFCKKVQKRNPISFLIQRFLLQHLNLMTLVSEHISFVQKKKDISKQKVRKRRAYINVIIDKESYKKGKSRRNIRRMV